MTNNLSFKITLLITLFCATLSCSIENQNLVENNFVQVSVTPTPLKFFKDENGNYIKEDGWEIPKFEVKKKKQLSVQLSINKEGKAIKIYSYNITPKNQVLIKEPFPSDELNKKFGLVKVDSIIETTGKNQPPYCYSLFVRKFRQNEETENNNNSHDHTIVYKICDANGDGIFETQPLNKFPVPSWVK